MKVTVLLSTFNGEKYLREQLDSLVNQDLKPYKVLIRDDGSTDETINILEEYCSKYDFVKYYYGKNLGPAKSFFDLINNCEEADYYALCDQDDVWFKNKLSSAITLLKQEDNNLPLLYMGRFILTDKDLNPLNSNMSSLYSYTDFAHALIYHSAPGCTFVFNNKARLLINEYDYNKEYCVIHDSIIHKIVAMFGKVVLDQNPYMYYRQHGSNVYGLTADKRKEFIHRVNNFLNGNVKNYRSNMAASLLNVYGNKCSKENKELLEIVAKYKNNQIYKKTLLKNECFKTHTINDFYFKLLVLAKYI